MPVQATPEASILASLDGLLLALQLERVDRDLFRAGHEPPRFPRVFGGQLAAQAMQAAAATVDEVDGPRAHSIHATFVRSGSRNEPIVLAVDRVRDGRTTATRQVTAMQDGRTVLIATVSFHVNPAGAELDVPGPLAPSPEVPGPGELPALAHWAEAAPPHLRERARHMWVDLPPPLDIRVGEAFTFLGGSPALAPRSHWLRLPRQVGDDPTLQTVLLTYASDYFLLDMAVRAHPARITDGAPNASTLDHSLWLHRPVRFDQWHLYTQQTVAFAGARGLVQGAIHDTRGSLVATTMQQVIVPPPGD